MLTVNLLDEFRAAARRRNVPDDVIDWWLQLARPVLELHRDCTGPVVGWFGGKPALPEDVEWPPGMTYLAKLDLSAIPAGSHDLRLPPDGHLLFFSEPDIAPEAQVVYVPAGTPVTERDRAEGSYEQECEQFPVYGVRGWDIPISRADSTIDIGESRYDEAVFSEIKWYLDGHDDCVGTIGGYTDRSTGGGGDHGLDSPGAQTFLGYLYLDDELAGEGFGRDGMMVGWVLANEDLAARRFDRTTTVSDFNG
jgi:hypothetical protein